MGEKKFSKPAKSEEELISFLSDKGLAIDNVDYAKRQLRYIGYYRLKIYMSDFKDQTGRFIQGTAFEDVVKVYDFDRRLRLVSLDAIERIEVALRSSIINVMGLEGGPHFYYKEEYFHKKDAVTRIRGMAENGKHLSIKHYKAEYSYPYLPCYLVFDRSNNIWANIQPFCRFRSPI